MKKRILSLLLTIVMLVSLVPAALATGRDVSAAEEQAAALKTLGLFKGVSDTDFDLTRAPSRVEALVILIRNLGQESKATSGSWSHPFTDVPDWADSYVGYAYENGLTNGVSATEFGTADASATMFLTFTLRALGYSDTNGADFSWDNPFTLATQKGILTEGVDQTNFWRADAVLVSAAALSATLKDSSETLADKLIAEGVFTSEAYEAAFPAAEPEWGTIVNPTVTDSTLKAPTDIHFGTRDDMEWTGNESVAVQIPTLLWTGITEADWYVINMYDEHDKRVIHTTYCLGIKDELNWHYDLTWLLTDFTKDCVISTITVTPINSVDGSVESIGSSGNDYNELVGETAVFKCSCAVTVKQGEAVAASAAVSEWSDEYYDLTFAGTYEPLAPVTLSCNYAGDDGGRGTWGHGSTVDGDGKLMINFDTEEYQDLQADGAKPELLIVSNYAVENETTACGTLTIYPVTIQP